VNKGGWVGQVLKVDLTYGLLKSEESEPYVEEFLGGTGTIMRPIAGVFIVTFSLDLFRFIGEYRFFIYDILLILIILFKPQGLYAGLLDLLRKLNPMNRNEKIG
jgi:hypothetical protein